MKSIGRGLQKFKDILNNCHLLYPDILVASCGTEIYTVQNSQKDLEGNPFQLVEDWGNYITQDNWNLEILTDFIQHELPSIEINVNEGYSRFKGSFVLKESDARRRDVMDAIIKKAAKEINQNWKYVISGYGTHRFIDILPERADKGSSLQYICKKILKFDHTKSVAFGDSLNDVDMLISAGTGFIVGNAQFDLFAWYSENGKRFLNVQCSPYEEGDAIVKYLEKIIKEGHR